MKRANVLRGLWVAALTVAAWLCGVVVDVCAQNVAPAPPLDLATLTANAQAGDAEAQERLGEYHFQLKQYPAAVEWYRKAAGQKNSDALFMLGLCYAEGLGVAKSDENAAKCFLVGGKESAAAAAFMLAFFYSEGLEDVIQPDDTRSIYWVRFAAELGHADALGLLGQCYAEGTGVEQNHTEALKWLQLAAKAGNPGAMGMIGDYFAMGLVVKQNHEQAAKWYQVAANAGDVESMYNLGVCYQNGVGVKMDDKTAFQWYQKAANEGMPEAQYNVGLFYYEGQVVPEDDKAAFEWFTAAAEQGFKPAAEALKDFEVEE